MDNAKDGVSIDKYVDGKIDEIQRAVDLAHAAEPKGVPLREYVESIFEEHKRALEMAERERERSAQALEQQLREARVVAQSEREKSAQALATELQRAIKEGDERLREHIANQISQIDAALESAEKLEIQRMQSVENHIEWVQEGLEQAQNSSEKAIQKAEAASEKRFESVNEFREQLNDQANNFLPRETFETQMEALQQWRTTIDARLNYQTGANKQDRYNESKVQPWHIAIAGFGVTIFVTAVIFIANLLTAA